MTVALAAAVFGYLVLGTLSAMVVIPRISEPKDSLEMIGAVFAFVVLVWPVVAVIVVIRLVLRSIGLLFVRSLARPKNQ